MRGPARSFAAPTRVGGWITWAESPGSPILYIQRLYQLHGEEGEASPMPYISTLYERHTREDFPEFMEKHPKVEVTSQR